MPNRINIARAENVVSIKASLEAFVYKESETGLYVSCCPALDLYSQGETRKEARKNIFEATELFIGACIEDQTLEQVLADCGFQFHRSAASSVKNRRAKKAKMPPEIQQSKPFRIPVQLPMAAYD